MPGKLSPLSVQPILHSSHDMVLCRVASPIDGRNLTGVPSIRVTQPRDYKGEGNRLLRWTELFIIRTEDASSRSASSRTDDHGDVTRFAEGVAKAASVALTLKIAQLEPHTLVGLRVSLDGDSVSVSRLFSRLVKRGKEEKKKYSKLVPPLSPSA